MHQRRDLVEFAQGFYYKNRRRAYCCQLLDMRAFAHFVSVKSAWIGFVKHPGHPAGVEHIHQQIGTGTLHADDKHMLPYTLGQQGLPRSFQLAPKRALEALS